MAAERGLQQKAFTQHTCSTEEVLVGISHDNKLDFVVCAFNCVFWLRMYMESKIKTSKASLCCWIDFEEKPVSEFFHRNPLGLVQKHNQNTDSANLY